MNNINFRKTIVLFEYKLFMIWFSISVHFPVSYYIHSCLIDFTILIVDTFNCNKWEILFYLSSNFPLLNSFSLRHFQIYPKNTLIKYWNIFMIHCHSNNNMLNFFRIKSLDKHHQIIKSEESYMYIVSLNNEKKLPRSTRGRV